MKEKKKKKHKKKQQQQRGKKKTRTHTLKKKKNTQPTHFWMRFGANQAPGAPPASKCQLQPVTLAALTPSAQPPRARSCPGQQLGEVVLHPHPSPPRAKSAQGAGSSPIPQPPASLGCWEASWRASHSSLRGRRCLGGFCPRFPCPLLHQGQKGLWVPGRAPTVTKTRRFPCPEPTAGSTWGFLQLE